MNSLSLEAFKQRLSCHSPEGLLPAGLPAGQEDGTGLALAWVGGGLGPGGAAPPTGSTSLCCPAKLPTPPWVGAQPPCCASLVGKPGPLPGRLPLLLVVPGPQGCSRPPGRLEGTLWDSPPPPLPQSRGSGPRDRAELPTSCVTPASQFACLGLGFLTRELGSVAHTTSAFRGVPPRGARPKRGGGRARREREVARRRGRPGRSVEGLEGLALQRGLDPADPALASSSADVPAAEEPEHPAGQGPRSRGAPALASRSPHSQHSTWGLRKYVQ